MKNKVLKIIMILLLGNVLAVAEPIWHSSDTKSLIGVEGSISSFDVENDANPALRDEVTYGGLGLKIGAQTDSYRFFLSASYNVIDGYDYAYLLGIEAQYLLNITSNSNLFLGFNAGYSDLALQDSEGDTRNFDSPYFGIGAGFNIHLNENFDLEFGGRIMTLTDSKSLSTKNNVVYVFDNIVTGYTSIIYKYNLD